MKTSYLPAPILLVGNKSDVVAERQVSTQEGSALAKQLDCEFVEVSAKSFVSTQSAFFKVVRQLRKQQACTLQLPHLQHQDDNRKEERRRRKHSRLSWFTKSRWFGNTRRSGPSHTRAPSTLKEPHTRVLSPSKELHTRVLSPSKEPHTRAPSRSEEPHTRTLLTPERSSMVSSSIHKKELLALEGVPNGAADVSKTKEPRAKYTESEARNVSQSELVDKAGDDPQHSSLINKKAYGAQIVLMVKMTKTLFCTEELEPILATALKDPDIGAEHLQDKITRMIQCFGRDLQAEAREKVPYEIAQTFGTPSVISHAARLLIQHLQRSSPEHFEEGKPTHWGSDADTDSHGSSTNILSENVEILSTMERRDIHDLQFNSQAYRTLKADLLEFTHKPYEKRVLSTFGSNLVGSDGECLKSDTISHVAEEISWVPTRLLEFSHDTTSSRSDSLKAFVEQSMGETWNWWPLAPRLHALRFGYCRLKWKSVRIRVP